MKISEELIREQNIIIDSDESKIVVSAGPGSGKTYTLTRKCARELENLKAKNINKGVILCSFTRESALDLTKKINNLVDNEFSFIGTIDAFLFSKIINPFKNRILKILKPNTKLITKKLKVHFPSSDWKDPINILTKEGITPNNHDTIKEFCNDWIQGLSEAKYDMSFAAYLFAGKAIQLVPELKSYLINRFNSIYIDEAQDLNFFQMRFIKKLIETTGINCYLVGDKRQSIYGFRGARPELFYSLVDEGFVEYKITHSARCHYNILEFSRAIVGEANVTNKLTNGNRVINNYSIINNLNYLKTINNYFILTETQNQASDIYAKCLENNITNVVYSKKIVINTDKDFSDNYFDLIEEMIKFYFNHTNKNPKFSYSQERLSSFLETHVSKQKLSHTNLRIEDEETIEMYLLKIFSLMDVAIPKQVLLEIRDQINQDVYKNHYILKDNINRIMTIHSSKGLEADYVFLQFQRNTYYINDETKRRLFVGFTRAKEQLIIGFEGGVFSHMEDYINKYFNELF